MSFAKPRLLLWVVSTLILATTKDASAAMGFRGLAAQVAAVSPSGADVGFGVGAHVDLGEVTDDLFVQPSFQYWKATRTDTVLFGEMDFDLSLMSIGADVLWYPAGERDGWYVGAGAYYNRVERELFFGELNENRVGANAIGGYDFSLGGSSAFAEARYHAVSGFNTIQLGVGYRFGG